MRTTVFAALIALTICLPVAAQTYRCVSASGEKIFRDTPCPSNAKVKEEYFFEAPTLPSPTASQQEHGNSIKLPPFKKHKESPTIRISHDPRGMPAKFSLNVVERAIQAALGKWNEGCNVNLLFSGSTRTAAPLKQSAETGYMIQWEAVGYSREGARVGGLGGISYGVTLSSIDMHSEAMLRSVIAHELGHVLGISHIHEDRNSVMSYLRHREEGTLQFSASDYLSCNIAMNSRFGIPFEPPKDAKASTMTDADARRQAEEESRRPWLRKNGG